MYFLSKGHKMFGLKNDRASQGAKHREMKSLAYNDIGDDNLLLIGKNNRVMGNEKYTAEFAYPSSQKDSKKKLNSYKKEMFPPLKRRY